MKAREAATRVERLGSEQPTQTRVAGPSHMVANLAEHSSQTSIGQARERSSPAPASAPGTASVDTGRAPASDPSTLRTSHATAVETEGRPASAGEQPSPSLDPAPTRSGGASRSVKHSSYTRSSPATSSASAAGPELARAHVDPSVQVGGSQVYAPVAQRGYDMPASGLPAYLRAAPALAISSTPSQAQGQDNSNHLPVHPILGQPASTPPDISQSRSILPAPTVPPILSQSQAQPGSIQSYVQHPYPAQMTKPTPPCRPYPQSVQTQTHSRLGVPATQAGAGSSAAFGSCAPPPPTVSRSEVRPMVGLPSPLSELNLNSPQRRSVAHAPNPIPHPSHAGSSSLPQVIPPPPPPPQQHPLPPMTMPFSTNDRLPMYVYGPLPPPPPPPPPPPIPHQHQHQVQYSPPGMDFLSPPGGYAQYQPQVQQQYQYQPRSFAGPMPMPVPSTNVYSGHTYTRHIVPSVYHTHGHSYPQPQPQPQYHPQHHIQRQLPSYSSFVGGQAPPSFTAPNVQHHPPPYPPPHMKFQPHVQPRQFGPYSTSAQDHVPSAPFAFSASNTMAHSYTYPRVQPQPQPQPTTTAPPMWYTRPSTIPESRLDGVQPPLPQTLRVEQNRTGQIALPQVPSLASRVPERSLPSSLEQLVRDQRIVTLTGYSAQPESEPEGTSTGRTGMKRRREESDSVVSSGSSDGGSRTRKKRSRFNVERSWEDVEDGEKAVDHEGERQGENEAGPGSSSSSRSWWGRSRSKRRSSFRGGAGLVEVTNVDQEERV